MTVVRKLTTEDAAAFRAIRLECLGAHPEAFGTTQEEERARDFSHHVERLAEHDIFGGFDGDRLVGIAAFSIYPGEKNQHKGMLYSVYVQPPARGTGLAAALVEAVLEQARGRVELVQLHVSSNNDVARRLYERLGFQRYGTEPRALKVDGEYYDEDLMYLLLT